MAVMHPYTTLVPSKLELLAAWLPEQPWFDGDAGTLQPLGAYRLDDPAGEVGIEGHLLSAGGDTVYHVPLSYRGAPIDGAEAHLVGTMEHGVLGTRWVSNAIADPVFREVLAATIAQGGAHAPEFNQSESGELSPRESRTKVRGSGEPGAAVPAFGAVAVAAGSSVATGEDAVLEVKHVLDASLVEQPGQLSLRGTWPGQEVPVILALLSSGAPRTPRLAG